MYSGSALLFALLSCLLVLEKEYLCGHAFSWHLGPAPIHVSKVSIKMNDVLLFFLQMQALVLNFRHCVIFDCVLLLCRLARNLVHFLFGISKMAEQVVVLVPDWLNCQ